MPRYFFHYRTDEKLVEDTTGRDCPNLEAAEESAAELGRAIIDRAVSTGDDAGAPRSIEITDSAGHELLYVVFWAGPKIGEGPASPVGPATLH